MTPSSSTAVSPSRTGCTIASMAPGSGTTSWNAFSGQFSTHDAQGVCAGYASMNSAEPRYSEVTMPMQTPKSPRSIGVLRRPSGNVCIR
jgi:hypothetical protein